MVIQLFGHPFSSYTSKAKIALYENDTPFDFRMVDPDHRENGAELACRSAIDRRKWLKKEYAANGRLKSTIRDPRRPRSD